MPHGSAGAESWARPLICFGVLEKSWTAGRGESGSESESVSLSFYTLHRAHRIASPVQSTSTTSSFITPRIDRNP